MRFGEAYWLHLLWLLPFLIAFVVWGGKRRNADLARWCRPALWNRMLPTRRASIGYWKAGLLLVAVFFLVLTVARPQVGNRVLTVTRTGIDVVIALDVSESMLAEDLKPNRVTRARHEIQSLIERLRGDRIGLVAFAGDAFVQCPITLDYAAARMFLRFMDTDLVPVPGTAIARSIEVATAAFEQDQTKFKALVLITDGEDHEGKMMDAARKAKSQGVRIFAVGIGTEKGEPIPVRDAQGGILDYKRDAAGEVILTRCDPTALVAMCRETGGQYYNGNAGGIALDQLYDEISGMEEREMEGGIVTQYEDRYGYFAAVALLFLLIEWMLSNRRRWNAERVTRGAAVGMSMLGILSGGHALADDGQKLFQEGEFDEARALYEAYTAENPEDAKGEYNLGTALHKTGEFEPAEDALQRALRVDDPFLKSQAFYNLGNTQAKKGDLEAALESYKMSLRHNPSDSQAKRNLELVDRLLQQAPPDSSQQEQDPNSQSEDEENQDEQDQDQEQENQDEQDQDQDQDQEDQDPQDQDQEQQDQNQDQDEQDQQDQQDQEEQDEEQQDSQSQQDEEQEQDPEEQPANTQPQPEELKISPEEARRILEALAQQEMQLQQERMKSKSRNIKVEKDW